jgi:hypothetical protein
LGERRYSSCSFTTLSLGGVSGQHHAPAALYPRRKDPPPPGTQWTGGWGGPRADLGPEDTGKSFAPCWGSNPDLPVVQHVVRHYTILPELTRLLIRGKAQWKFARELLYIVTKSSNSGRRREIKIFSYCSCLLCETISLNCGHQLTNCSSPSLYT